MHYYQFNIGDYRRDTAHLSRLEHGIYRDLIDWYYLEESPIPLETQSVSRRLRLATEDEAKALENVLSDFFVRADGWRHKRIDQDIIEYHAMAEKNRKNGKLGGRPKKTQSVPTGNPDETQSKGNQEPITKNQYIDTDVSIKDKRAPRFDAQAHLSSLGVPAQIASDWIAHRRAKRSAPTRTAIDGVAREAASARIALSDALGMCCERGWVGFKAEWVSKDSVPMSGHPPNGRRPTLTETRIETISALTGRTRTHGQQQPIERDITPGTLRIA